MTKDTALYILGKMMDGTDPLTGEVLPEDHLCNHPEVLRALHLAILSMTNENDEKKPEIKTKEEKQNKKLNAGRPWTKEDLDELEQLYNAGTAMDEICRILQRRTKGIEKQLIYLGLKESEKKAAKKPTPGLERAGLPWLREEDEHLEQLYHQRLPVSEIEALLHRSEYSIFCRMERFGFCGDVEGYPSAEDITSWNRKDNDTLKKMYLEGVSVDAIAEHFGHNKKSISTRLFYMGLIKEAPFSIEKN